MHILFLCNKSPYPPKEGGPMAMNANIEGLISAGHKVKVIALNTNKYFVKNDEIHEEYKNKTGIEFVYTNLSVNPLGAFLNLFSKKSYHVERFFTKEFEQKIIEELEKDKYDIVQLEMLYMTPYINVIRKYSDAKIILRSHNIEHLIWERIASVTKNPLPENSGTIITAFELINSPAWSTSPNTSTLDICRFFNQSGIILPAR